MKLIIGGDILPQKCNMKEFEAGDISSIISSSLQRRLSSADYVLANLEGPLTESIRPIKKSGPCIKASVGSAYGLSLLGINCFSLANNHIMDYGAEGFESTITALQDQNISYFGAGETKYKAKKPHIVSCNGVRIGIYACAEHEFTIANAKRPGANLFDALYVLDDISELKSQVDHVIVLYHGSKEYYRYPVPYVQERCRRMVDKGASLVLCQHSHCIGCKEQWKTGEILYGQGNFLFNRVDDEYRHSGLIVEVTLERDSIDVDYIPIVRNNIGISEPSEIEYKEIISDFDKRTEEIKSSDFVNRMYSQFAADKLDYYNYSILPDIFIIRLIKKLFKKAILKQGSKEYDANLLNILRCEAHRDLYIKGIVDKNLFDDYLQ